MTYVRRGLLLLLLLAASGCSVQLAYNNLDRLARWSLSDYVDMDSAQRAYFDAAFDDLWVWHRGSHLPQYADFLETVAVRFADGTSEAEMQRLVDQVVVWAEEVQERAMPATVEMLASLSDAQVEALARTLAERNREMAEPELDVPLEEIRMLWQEEFTERFTRFSGRLTPVQRAYLSTRAEDYRPERVLWAEYRERWQGDLLALLRYRHDTQAFGRGLRELIAHRELYYGPELNDIEQHNVALLRHTSVWLVNSLTDRQRQRFADRLTDLADDFRQLSVRAVTPASEVPCLVSC